MNEQTTTTPRPQITTWALSQTGPCARCHTSMCRYGVGGNPCSSSASRPGRNGWPAPDRVQSFLVGPDHSGPPDGQAIERVRLYERQQLDTGTMDVPHRCPPCGRRPQTGGIASVATLRTCCLLSFLPVRGRRSMEGEGHSKG